MTQASQPFPQHSRLSELVTALGFRRNINEIGIQLLHHWFPPQRSAPPVITGSEVLGVVPLEVTDALLDTFHRLADRHERGFLVEQVMELLATS